jgi:dTDP-4-dehydrorhamnose 3,5-epimerase
MRLVPTRLDGPILVEPTVHGDARGFFLESYRANVWAEHGISDTFVQDNHSRSGRGVLRGMHFSIGAGQAKLVRCARGRILDVVVDLRRASPTYGTWEGVELDDELARQLYIPVGFAHGFCVLSEIADVTYKCSTYYDGAIERGFRFDDPAVAIAWPSDTELVVSERDSTAPTLAEIASELPF